MNVNKCKDNNTATIVMQLNELKILFINEKELKYSKTDILNDDSRQRPIYKSKVQSNVTSVIISIINLNIG